MGMTLKRLKNDVATNVMSMILSNRRIDRPRVDTAYAISRGLSHVAENNDKKMPFEISSMKQASTKELIPSSDGKLALMKSSNLISRGTTMNMLPLTVESNAIDLSGLAKGGS